MTKKYNLKKLVRVENSGFEETRYIFKEPEIKRILFWNRKTLGGVFEVYNGHETRIGEMPSNCMLIDGEVLRKPIVELVFQGGVNYYRYFDSVVLAADWFYMVTASNNNWLTVGENKSYCFTK